MEIVQDQTDPDGGVVLDSSELLRLLEESAHAYMMLQEDARNLYSTIDEAGEILRDRTLGRRLGWRR